MRPIYTAAPGAIQSQCLNADPRIREDHGTLPPAHLRGRGRRGEPLPAAEKLHLSQPAVSAHVKSLEEELGVGLFTRTVRGMDLTDSGRRLTATARDALSRAQDLVEQARCCART